MRVSTRKEEQRSSIENQKRLLNEWALFNGHEIVRHYVDIRTGAYAGSRREMEELRRDVIARRIDGIVTKEISRTSRDILDLLELKRELASCGACFISIKEGYDSRTDEDEFFLLLHGGLAQRERKVTSSRVKLTQMLKARDGKTNVATPAFGYKRTADGGHLEPDPVRAPIYREIVWKFLSGWGQSKIAKWLNQRGIKPNRGRRWYPNAVRIVLTNPVYLGVTIYNATTLVRDAETGLAKRVLRPKEEWVIKEGTHQPLLSRAEWELLQKEMETRRKLHWHEWQSGKRYLGSGVLRCGVCGSKLYGHGERRAYFCSDRDGTCKSARRSWNMDVCDKILMDLVAGAVSDHDRLLSAVVRHMRIGRDDLSQRRQKILELAARNREARQLESLAFEQGAITVEEYQERMSELRKESLSLRLELERLAREANSEGDHLREASAIAKKMADLLRHPDELEHGVKLALVSAVLHAVYIDSLYRVSSVYFT